MADILKVNDQLNNGEISIGHARTLSYNFRHAIKLISAELAAAKFTGKIDKTLERWFHRVHASPPPQNGKQNPNIIEQLMELVEELRTGR